MARLPRINPVGIAQHIIQRGNNRQVCFTSERDFSAYIGWLKEYSKKYQVDIHAWVLMTNHVHILCTPHNEQGIRQVMQSLGRQYVRYFNKTHNRTGTLWEGRYKSCLVEAECYLLELYRYIELNPVRANMVTKPSEYKWSSYQINGLGMQSELCTAHPLYLAIDKHSKKRLESYQAFISERINAAVLKDIRQATNKGMAVGSENFKQHIEATTGRRMRPAKMGRPRIADS